MRDVLITGTDTGIGKTVVAAALVKGLRADGVRALGFKPAETGLERLDASDSDLLQRASGETTPLAIPLLQLAEPLAPAVAADRAGAPIHPEEIEQRIETLRRAGYTLVIEGAGGVMVPLSWERGAVEALFPHQFYTVLDLAEHCGLDAVIVARAGLGTLNHIMMTAAMLRARDIPIRGVVLNGRHSSPSPDLAEDTNPSALGRMLPGVLVVQVPHHASGNPIDATVPYLTRLRS